jgi:hydrogenase-4 component F
MGIIMIAFAVSEYAGKAGLIHVMGHSMIKAAFFLSAGNVYRVFGKKNYDQCGGLLAANPVSGWLWLLSFAFIIGMPPSPLFVSEFYIVLALLKSTNIAVLITFLVLLSSIAYGLGRASLAITMGSSDTRSKLPLSQYLPQIALLLSAVLLPFILQYLL